MCIRDSSLPAGTVSGSAQLASAISGSIAGQTGSLDSAISTAQTTANTGVSDAAAAQGTANSAQSTANSANTTANNLATQVVIDSNGMSLKNAAADKTLASFGTTVTIGEDANDKSRMVLDADSLDLIVDASGTDTTHASFGATTTIGPTASEHVRITSSGLELKDGSTVRLTMDSSGIAMGNQFAVDSSGNASFSGTLSVGSLPAGTVSGSAQLASAISGSIAGQTGSLDSAISTAQSLSLIHI